MTGQRPVSTLQPQCFRSTIKLKQQSMQTESARSRSTGYDHIPLNNLATVYVLRKILLHDIRLDRQHAVPYLILCVMWNGNWREAH